MDDLRQRTLATEVHCSGIGLHSGAAVNMVLRPAADDCGVRFRRVDLPGQPIVPATTAAVADTSLATTLASGEARVGTVEHLFAALWAAGIDNLEIAIDAGEVPALDGSAAPFLELIDRACVVSQRRSKRLLVMTREVSVGDGDRRACLAPASRFSVACEIAFPHPLIGDQSIAVHANRACFERDIARARTFGFQRDLEKLQRSGFARGGSTANAVVVGEERVLNPEGLRWPDEFVRHKVLDALGDLFLFGLPIVGHLRVRKSGHGLHHQLVRAVLGDPSAYEIVEATPREAERLGLELPAESRLRSA